jgi:hypothetical protein
VVQPEHVRAETSDLFPVHAGFPGGVLHQRPVLRQQTLCAGARGEAIAARGARTAAHTPEDDDSDDADGAGDENDQKQATEVLAAGVSAA